MAGATAIGADEVVVDDLLRTARGAEGDHDEERNAGEAFSKSLGHASDRMQADGRADVQKLPDHKVTTLDAAEAERWKQILAPMVEEWVRDVPDGTRVLAAYRDELVKIRSTP